MSNMRLCARVWAVFVAAAAWAADWNGAIALFKKGDYAGALKLFEAVLQENPNYAGSYFYVAMCLEKLGDSDKALLNYQKANQLEPTNPTFAQALSRLLVDKGKGAEAVRVLEAVPTVSFQGEQKATFFSALARAKLAAGDPAGAAEAAKTATQANPSLTAAWSTLGMAHSRLGKDREAFAAYRRAFEISGDPQLAVVAAQKAINAARLSQGQEANSLYSQAAAVAVKGFEKKASSELALLAAEAYLGADRYDDSLSWLDKVGSNSALVTYYRGANMQKKGDAAKAEKLFREALGKEPDQHLRRLIYSSLGYVLDLQKRYKDAEQAYREAGNAAKAAEMREKQVKYEQNLKADEEARRIEELRRTQEELKKLRGGAATTPTPNP
ncbi:MAG: tetratricopeptide repeat protein [Thermoanaerobaculaceae bacterium]